MDWLKQILDQAFAAFRAMTAAQRASMAMLALTIAVTLGLVVFLGARPKYVTLVPGLDQTEMADVIRYLDDAGEEYKLDKARGAVLVHQERKAVLAKRLVAGNVVSAQKVLDYAWYDERASGLHRSEADKQRLFNIALAGELEKMLVGLKGVERAQVTIKQESRSAFGPAPEPVGVSVTLSTKRSVKLDQAMANTVIDLVHNAVRNSDPRKITVVDSGNWSRRFGREDPESVIVQGGTRWDLTRGVNDLYTRKIKKFISDAGYESAVTVDSKLDLDAASDAVYTVKGDENITVSLEKRKVTTTGAAGAGGPTGLAASEPGVSAGSTLPGSVAPSKPSEHKEEFSKELVDYSRVLREITTTPGKIEDIKVAVILFHRIVQKKDEKSGRVEQVFEAPGDEEKKEWPELVAKAAGLGKNQEDLDKIKVVFMKPARPIPTSYVEPVRPLQERMLSYAPMARIAGVCLLATFALFFLYGLGKKAATTRPVMEAAAARAGAAAEEAPEMEAAEPEEARLHEMQTRIRSFVEQDPRKVAGLVKRWLTREG